MKQYTIISMKREKTKSMTINNFKDYCKQRKNLLEEYPKIVNIGNLHHKTYRFFLFAIILSPVTICYVLSYLVPIVSIPVTLIVGTFFTVLGIILSFIIHNSGLNQMARSIGEYVDYKEKKKMQIKNLKPKERN